MSSDNTVIKVEGIKKTFKIPLDGASGIKQKILNITKGKKGYRNFTPLNGISFDIKEGEFFGIVGRNGSGKSTLLKTIAGIYSPDAGTVSVDGLLVPFIELGVGFNPDLTGKENVYLNAALLGFSRDEIAKMYGSIVDFAELHDFMEEQLKNYSSGMQVRLAFSIAIQAKGDILLLDEVLAVGDAAFQQKCYDYFEELKEEKKTIILVTHGMDAVKRFCNRALLLEDGKIKMIGSPSEVADQYTVDNLPHKDRQANSKQDSKVSSLDAYIDKTEYTRDDTARLTVEYSLAAKFIPALGMSIIKDGHSVAEINSRPVELSASMNKQHQATLDIALERFTEGTYSVDVVIFNKDTMSILEVRRRAAEFVIKGSDRVHGGAVYITGDWQQGVED
ncbi:ATP-binding cassette domain-containing protein [Candidatus Saccharibacteria bacterium]|nr:ATP-binding cassette domain-containing protein [Candidatus Saccharibacteria bacterium]